MAFGSEDTAIFFRDGSVAVLADGSTARVHLDYPEPIEDFAGTSLPGQIVGKPVMTFPTGLLVNRDDAINVGGTDYKVRTVRKIADGLLSVAELKLAAVLLFVLGFAHFAGAEARTYRHVNIAALAAGKVRATHVEIAGTVTFVKREADGDLHVRVCDSPRVNGMDRQHCVVAEIIPTLRPLLFCPDGTACSVPKWELAIYKGQSLTFRGISRRDPDHGWYEVHPVEEIAMTPEVGHGR
jgi:hypothetical protein